MELNFLNDSLNVNVEKHHVVDEKTFWYYYCKMLNVRKDNLSDKDCELLAFILSKEIDYNINGNMKEISTDTNIAVSNLYTKFKQLNAKDFLLLENNQYYLHPFLKSFQSYIKSNDNLNIKFSLPFIINKT